MVVVEGSYPSKYEKRILYVLTEDGEMWEGRMICPCGCSDTVDLNLLPDQRPVWKAWAGKKGEANLHPSVWRHVACRSHYILRDGRIRWCE